MTLTGFEDQGRAHSDPFYESSSIYLILNSNKSPGRVYDHIFN